MTTLNAFGEEIDAQEEAPPTTKGRARKADLAEQQDDDDTDTEHCSETSASPAGRKATKRPAAKSASTARRAPNFGGKAPRNTPQQMAAAAKAAKASVKPLAQKSPQKSVAVKTAKRTTGGKSIPAHLEAKARASVALASATKAAARGPVTANGDPSIARRKHKFRPGTVALREIRHFQKTTHTVVPVAVMSRLVREISSNEASGRDKPVRFTRGALAKIQEAAESHATSFIRVSQQMACIMGRKSPSEREARVLRLHRQRGAAITCLI